MAQTAVRTEAMNQARAQLAKEAAAEQEEKEKEPSRFYE